MTIDKLYSLQDSYNAALKATNGGTTSQCRQWMLDHFPYVLEDNIRTLALIGWDAGLRDYRKKQSTPEHRQESKNFCLDLGMRAIRSYAAKIVPGRTDIPLRDLIKIRQQNGGAQ